MTSWLMHGLQNLYALPPVFESSDPHMTKTETTEFLKEHTLTWQTGTVNSALRCTSVGALSFLVLRYGAAVHVAPGALHDFYLFQVPIQGQSRIGVGQHRIHANYSTGTIISPELALRLDWEEDCEQFLIKIPAERLIEACAVLLDVTPQEKIEFHPRFDLTQAHGMAWKHQINALLTYISTCSQPPAQWLKSYESSLLQHLLLTQPNNFSHYFNSPTAVNGSRRLRLARRYIHANLNQDLSLAQIAAACDSSVRSMTLAFREQLNLSPQLYIRQARLEAVRHALLHAAPTATVTEIATFWGFNHLGRFSAWYKERYEESPSDTLHK
ncbi:AraC family transcriptional regulator [Paenalcaligenes hominis]|uniref:AraC family transcriptional regulator n=1 Tax=Paenalcaligenes hominis TaxID=643674 RepID=UPI0035264A3A